MSIFDNVIAGLKLNGNKKNSDLDDIVEKNLKHAGLWEEVKEEAG